MNRSRPLLPILFSIALSACSDDPAVAPPPTVTVAPSATSTLPPPTSTSTVPLPPLPTSTSAPMPSSTSTVTPTPEIGCCGDGTVDDGEQCDDGNEVGGDDCAANCTLEHVVNLALSGEMISQSASFTLSLAIDSQQSFRLGEATSATSRPSCEGSSSFAVGEIPLAQRVEDLAFDPVSVPGIACACIRPVAARRCGAPLIRRNGRDCSVALDCTADPSLCGDPSACRFAHGEANASSGVIGCAGLDAVDYVAEVDDIAANFTCTRSGGRSANGAAFIYSSASMGVIMGNPMCLEDTSNAANGPDGIPCSEDDPATSRGGIRIEVRTTGFAGPPLIGPGQASGTEDAPGAPREALGAPFDCAELPGAPRLCSSVTVISAPGAEQVVSTCLEP
jgi:cysteine-rich repeat protein